MGKIRNVMWDILSILCIMVIVSMAASRLLTGWCSIFYYRAFYIMSESMEPEIAVNQLVLGEYVSEDEELESGEIYAYRKEGVVGHEIIIHRLVAITEDGQYQFKGDNNELPDEETVEREDIGYEIIRQ